MKTSLIGFILVIMVGGMEKEMAFSSSQRGVINHAVRNNIHDSIIKPVFEKRRAS